MTVDIEKIISLTGEIEKSLTILKDYSEQQKEEIVSDLKVLGSIK